MLSHARWYVLEIVTNLVGTRNTIGLLTKRNTIRQGLHNIQTNLVYGMGPTD